MIIVEGMDNSGKSTLCEGLAERFNLRVIKRAQGPPTDKDKFLSMVVRLLTVDPEVIYDRHPIISEAVYGPILREKNALNEELAWDDWMNALLDREPLIVYCRPPEEKILCFDDRDQMVGVPENAKRLIRRYDQVMLAIGNKASLFVRYDYTSLLGLSEVEIAVDLYLRARGGIEKYEYR